LSLWNILVFGKRIFVETKLWQRKQKKWCCPVDLTQGNVFEGWLNDKSKVVFESIELKSELLKSSLGRYFKIKFSKNLGEKKGKILC